MIQRGKHGLIQNIFDDMFVSHHTPNSISLDGVLFTLTLSNKKFVTEELKIDSSSDYVDIYLQSAKLHHHIMRLQMMVQI